MAARICDGYTMATELIHECSSTSRQEFLATDDKPYHFVECGLPNVFLVGVRYFHCECGEKYVEIPAIKQLMSLIARHTVMKDQALSGTEIKFLRKRLGQKAADFAASVKLQPETLSRVENGKQEVGAKTDFYIRIYYALSSKDPVLLDALKEAPDKALSLRRTKSPKNLPKTVAKIEHDEWALKATAGRRKQTRANSTKFSDGSCSLFVIPHSS
jgi:putative transcriptional regulator